MRKFSNKRWNEASSDQGVKNLQRTGLFVWGVLSACLAAPLAADSLGDVMGKKYWFEGANYFEFDQDKFVIDQGDSSTLSERRGGKYTTTRVSDFVQIRSVPYDFFLFSFEEYALLTVTRTPNGPVTPPISIRAATGSKESSELYPAVVVEVSAYLKEPTKNGVMKWVPGGELSRFELSNTPWVAGGNGLGESIVLKANPPWENTPSLQKFSRLVVSNGFFYKDNPTLYGLNSRIRTLRVDAAGSSATVTLKDTPQLQAISLPKTLTLGDGTTIRLTIVDTYPGSKYKDIALSGVYVEYDWALRK